MLTQVVVLGLLFQEISLNIDLGKVFPKLVEAFIAAKDEVEVDGLHLGPRPLARRGLS